MILGDELRGARSPRRIFIAAGTVHRAKAFRGDSVYVCILMDPEGPNSPMTERADLSGTSGTANRVNPNYPRMSDNNSISPLLKSDESHKKDD